MPQSAGCPWPANFVTNPRIRTLTGSGPDVQCKFLFLVEILVSFEKALLSTDAAKKVRIRNIRSTCIWYLVAIQTVLVSNRTSLKLTLKGVHMAGFTVLYSTNMSAKRGDLFPAGRCFLSTVPIGDIRSEGRRQARTF